MAQFDVHPHPGTRHREETPYVMVVQSDLLDGLDLAVIIPLRRLSKFRALGRLHPIVTVAGEKLCLVTTEITSIPVKRLEAPVANLSAERYAMLSALDLLLTGV